MLVSLVIIANSLVSSSATINFHGPLFSDGMILQRGANTKIWGLGATPLSTVTVNVQEDTGKLLASSKCRAGPNGTWLVSLPKLTAVASAKLVAQDESSTATVANVAVGDVLLCGGQSNMGFGMCGARSKSQTPQEALDALPPLRFFFQAGSGPHGGAGSSHCRTSTGEPSSTPGRTWFTANATNAGGASAVCMLTAQQLYHDLGGKVPVGAVESCISGTYVEPWTPPSGSLWQAHMEPLLPMTFAAALWDQGEADAKRTNSTWYSTEFPTMIKRWRSAFQTPVLPFFYVELCTEYGAKEPKERDFWLAQRSALSLPAVGFAVTTDIQRVLHPPDKQDVAQRLALEVRRIIYGESVVSRGPELVGASANQGTVVFTFSNASLTSRAGILVGNEVTCQNMEGADSLAVNTLNKSLNYTIEGAMVTVHCDSSNDLVQINSDVATCFLYGPTGLPAPPVQLYCNDNREIVI